MAILETINFRGNKKNCQAFILQLEETLSNLDLNKEGLDSINLYQNTRLEADFSLHLFHMDQSANQRKSDIGVYLQTVLSQHGLVSYSRWRSIQECV